MKLGVDLSLYRLDNAKIRRRQQRSCSALRQCQSVSLLTDASELRGTVVYDTWDTRLYLIDAGSRMWYVLESFAVF